MISCPSEHELRLLAEDGLESMIFGSIDRHTQECPACRRDWNHSRGKSRRRRPVVLPTCQQPGIFPRSLASRSKKRLGCARWGSFTLRGRSRSDGTSRSRSFRLFRVPTVGHGNAAQRGEGRFIRPAPQRRRHLRCRRGRFLALPRSRVHPRPEPEGSTARSDASADAAHLMAAIADAVHHIHQAGLLHFDLKPSNILLDGDSQAAWDKLTPKVADFGLAVFGGNREQRRDDHGRSAGNAILHGPEQAGTAGGRSKRPPTSTPWARALRIAHRPPALSGTIAAGNHRPGPHARASAPTAAEPEDPPRPGNHRAQVPREEPLPPLCFGRVTGRRPAPPARRPADRGTPGLSDRAPLALVPPAPAVAALAATLMMTFSVGFFTIVLLWSKAEVDRNRGPEQELSHAERAQPCRSRLCGGGCCPRRVLRPGKERPLPHEGPIKRRFPCPPSEWREAESSNWPSHSRMIPRRAGSWPTQTSTSAKPLTSGETGRSPSLSRRGHLELGKDPPPGPPRSVCAAPPVGEPPASGEAH